MEKQDSSEENGDPPSISVVDHPEFTKLRSMVDRNRRALIYMAILYIAYSVALVILFLLILMQGR